MAKIFPPQEYRKWPNFVAFVCFALSPALKKYVRDLEEFREAHRFD